MIIAIMNDMGITDYEPRVVNQLLEYSYRYVSTMLDDAKTYAAHAQKDIVDIDDIKLAVQMHTDYNMTKTPPRDLMLQVAAECNKIPLPIPREQDGLRLPAERYCLTAPNYRLKSRKTTMPAPRFDPLKKVQDTNNNNQKTYLSHLKQSSNAVGNIMMNGKLVTIGNFKGEANTNIAAPLNLPTLNPAIQINNLNSNASETGKNLQILPTIQFQPLNGPNGTPVFSMTVDPALMNSSLNNQYG